MRANFSQNVMNVFAQNETNYEEVKNLMFDLAMKRDMYDADGNKINKADAEKKLLDISRSIFGLSDGYTPRDFKRAIRDHAREWFDVIEEVVDTYIQTGMQENEFFNNFVEYRNLALGQENMFYIPEDIILSIVKVGTSHHDYSLQRYAAGETLTVPMARYGGAVGADINRYMAGQEDWDRLVAALSKAAVSKQQTIIWNEVKSAASKLPVQTGFVESGALSNTDAVKNRFRNVIANVSMANNGADVVIFGTDTALRQINNLADVQWANRTMKDDMFMMGRLGSFEGTTLVEIPNRFVDKTYNAKVFDDNILLFLPAGQDNKFIYFVTQGETEIDEITEKNEEHGRWDDLQKFEIQMNWGVAVATYKQFGQWTLPA